MLIYRAISFEKLLFLTDSYYSNLFKEALDETRSENSVRWWYQDSYKKLKMQIFRNIFDNQENFFEKSIDFNSKYGGRFNPSKSFGCVYTASDPTLSCLEVLYHSFDSNRLLYKNLKKSSDRISNAFNINVPDKFRARIVVFEIELNTEANIYEVCESIEHLKSSCKELGLKRYIDQRFDENFIFGNDYEISSILGCHLLAMGNHYFKVPSARLPLELQNNNGMFNLIITENAYQSTELKLTGKIREYDCSVNLQEERFKGYEVNITAIGNNNFSETIFLQPWPSKRNRQIIEYSQETDDERKYSRYVELQKYHDGDISP